MIEIISLALIPLLWIAAAIFDGLLEGWLYNYRDSKDLRYDKDLHKLFTVERAITMLGLLGWAFVIGPFWTVPILAVSLAMVFPLFHDGYYYETRKKISKGMYYPKGFFSNHNTTTAKFSLKSAWNRVILAAAGLLTYGVFVWLVVR